MANLKYKTRGNSTPQGKPRVYFCCQPEDFNRCFESISNEILAKQNCAVWYTDEVVVYDEDFFVDLKQMQLFVMPVTTNLLCTENQAIDVEFKFAIENHIPVMPLMQESGLEELFNKRCGDLQFLDKNNADTTAISYDDKLQKYLETVLIGDELAEKIRAAFDAYVFLSNRKKDRRYAQELMRLIHKNEFCRDIAIWYDEFLTPGENFNDSIKEALQKSGLFVLTVTPNLINEQNYIMTTEYPMAKQEGKPILPAELVPTDREILVEKYEDIPNPADAYNDAELSKALLDSIKIMNIKENDISPEHNFFIGLAYLGGVDVEIDYDIAIDLIRRAAENGLLEAVEKLVEIYDKGIGVRKNVKEAIFWQKRCIELLRERYEKEKTVNLCEKLFDKTIYVGNKTADIYGDSKAEEWYQSAKMLATDLVDMFKQPPVALFLAYQHHGLHCIRFVDEQTNLEKSLEILLQIIKINPSPIYRRELVTLYGQLGKVYDQSPSGIIPVGKVNWDRDVEYLHKVEQQADDYFCCCISTAKKLADETGSVADLRTLIEAHRRAAKHCRGHRNDKQAAILHYRECLRISKLVANSTDDIQDVCNIIKFLDELGRLHELKKERKTAKQYYKEALDNACSLVSRTQNILAKKAASKAWSTWARMYQIEENLTEEFACYDKMILLECEIIKEHNTYENCLSLIYSYKWYGKRCAVNNEPEKANELLTEALKLANKITEPNDTEKRMYELASVYYQYAILNPCILPCTKKKYLQSAIEIWDNLFSISWSYKELVKSAYEHAKMKLQELEGE